MSCLIALLMLLVFILSPPAAASNITINADHKTLTIDGQKTFFTAPMLLCWDWMERGWPVYYNSCSVTPNEYDGIFTFDVYTNTQTTSKLNTFNGTGVDWTWEAADISLIGSKKFHPNFVGYWQLDEPEFTYGSNTTVIHQRYDAVKAADANHPVWLNIYSNYVRWSPYTDIISWDIYPFKYCISGAACYSVITYNHNTEWAYFYENGTYSQFLSGSSTVNINSVGKPTFAILQGLGAGYNIHKNDRGGYTYFLEAPTPAEMRTQAFLAITMDVSGVGWWPGKDAKKSYLSAAYTPIGFMAYQQSKNSVFNIAKEIKSLNDILTMPTVNYSWQRHKNNYVLFSGSNLTYTLNGTSYNKLNYMLKQNSTHTYLIVVNKDSYPLNNTQITIPGISGTSTVTTIGNDTTTGTGKKGRTLTANNGQFTDSFDSFAVHIYQLTGGGSTSNPNAFDITFSNPQSNAIINVNYVNVATNVSGVVGNASAFIDYNFSMRSLLTFDNLSGKLIPDSSNNNLNWSFVSNVTSAPTIITPGRIGQNAISLTASNYENLTVQDDGRFNCLKNCTFGLWIYDDAIAGTGEYFIAKSGQSNGLNILISGSGGYVQFANGTGSFRNTTMKTYPNRWNHIVFVLNETGKGVTPYLNGTAYPTVSMGLGANPQWQYNQADNVTIGSKIGSSWFTGYIDDVFFDNRSYTSSEVLAAYNASTNALWRNFTNLPDGEANFTAYIRDDNGNAKTPTRFITIQSIPIRTHAALTFVVTDSISGLPIAGTTVSVDSKFRGQTDTTGTVSFTVAPGDYRYAVRAKGYVRTTDTVSVAGDTTVNVALVHK